MWRRKSASGSWPGSAWARRAREASPGPGERQRRAGDCSGGRASVPVSAVQRGHDGAARWALRTTPLLGLGHRLGALPLWADEALDRGDPAAGLHLAAGLRPESVDDAPAVDSGRARRQAAAAHQRVATMAWALFASSQRRAGCRLSVFADADDGHARRAGVRGSRARCMRASRRSRARSPPPPSRVVSVRARRRASTATRGPAHIHEGRREESVADERSQSERSR